jgi:hypothetical protein
MTPRTAWRLFPAWLVAVEEKKREALNWRRAADAARTEPGEAGADKRRYRKRAQLMLARLAVLVARAARADA